MSDELDDVAEPVLPADEAAAERSIHRERTSGVGKGHCADCGWRWPCRTSRLLDSHESLRVTVARLHTAAGDLLAAYLADDPVVWEIDEVVEKLQAELAALDASSILAPPGTVVAVVTRPDTAP